MTSLSTDRDIWAIPIFGIAFLFLIDQIALLSTINGFEFIEIEIPFVGL